MATILKILERTTVSHGIIYESRDETLETATSTEDLIAALQRNGEFFRSEIKRAAKYLYVVKSNRTLSRYHIMLGGRKGLQLDWVVNFNDADRCFYITCVNGIDVISTSEYELYHKALEVDRNIGAFNVLKVFLDYHYRAGMVLGGDAPGQSAREADMLAAVDRTKNPEDIYWEFAKFLLYERYNVNRDGLRTDACLMGSFPIDAGYCDYINPDRVESMQKGGYSIYWERPEFYGEDFSESDVTGNNFGRVMAPTGNTT